MKLRDLLQGCSSSQLSRLAASWALPVEAGTLRRELVELVAERLTAGLHDEQIWSELSGHCREIVRLLARAGGRHEADLLARRLLRARTGSADHDDEAHQAHRNLDGAISSLVDRGLVFRVFDSEEQRQGVYLVVTEEALDAVEHALGNDAGASGLVSDDFAPGHAVAIDLRADLFVLASAMRREAWSVISRELAGRPPRSVPQLLSLLHRRQIEGPGNSGQRWRFLLWIAQRAGWLQRDGWPVPDDEGLERALSVQGTLLSEGLAASPTGGGDERHGSSNRRETSRRQTDALQLLSELKSDRWWPADDVAAWLAETLVGPGTSDRAGNVHARRQRTQLYLRWLRGRWFWLGLVRWGGEGGEWTHVSPTPSLMTLMNGIPEIQTVTAEACVVDDDLQLVAPSGADLATLYRAEPYLALSGAGDLGGCMQGRQYRLTPASLDRGIRLGGDPDDALALLARLAQRPLSEAWQRAVRAWTDDRRRLRLGARLVLWSQESAALDESLTALGAAAAQDAGIERLSERFALVTGDRIAELLTALAQAGLPVDIEPSLRAEPGRPSRAASLAGGVAETAWIALEILRRLAPDVVMDQRDLRAASARLDAVLSPSQIETLQRRAATIAAAISERRSSRPRRRRALSSK